MSLSIPESEFDKFQKLVELSPDAFRRFFESVRASAPAITFRKFTDSIGEMTGSELSDIEAILSLLGPLSGIKERESMSPEELAKEVAESAVEEKPEVFSEKARILQ